MMKMVVSLVTAVGAAMMKAMRKKRVKVNYNGYGDGYDNEDD